MGLEWGLKVGFRVGFNGEVKRVRVCLKVVFNSGVNYEVRVGVRVEIRVGFNVEMRRVRGGISV